MEAIIMSTEEPPQLLAENEIMKFCDRTGGAMAFVQGGSNNTVHDDGGGLLSWRADLPVYSPVIGRPQRLIDHSHDVHTL
mmetsp:Transcript_8699/g.18728  ORF Transcript_8699/g.18728 Transcript_8699/m.18728 type:complete len:80 (+) Transcript_8699:1303-1542(+)